MHKDRNLSFNSFGQVGLIQTPTAESTKEATISLTLNQNDIWKFVSLSVSPFDWLEASYFYYRPSDLLWGGTSGFYLDKGFNVKFTRNSQGFLPNLSIGLDDFAGTGLFSKEYIVSTKKMDNMKLSLGIGWGKFAGKNTFENPFSFVSDKLINRNRFSENFNSGGSLGYDQWFRGASSLFGGIEWFFPNANGLKLKLEYDPYNYFGANAIGLDDSLEGRSLKLRKKTSNTNYGLSYPFNKFLTIDASYIKGNTFNVNLTFKVTLDKNLSKKKKFEPRIDLKENRTSSKNIFYKDLLHNLNQNRLFLQTASIKDTAIDVAISTSDYRSPIRSSSNAAGIIKTVTNHHNLDVGTINITHLNAGIELNKISYLASNINNNQLPIEVKISSTKFESGSNSYLNNAFKPKLKLPVFFNSISPILVSHIGNPGKVYAGGIDIQYISEIQFSRNLILNTEIDYSLVNNFDDLVSVPDSLLPNVRTEILKYLQQSDLYIKRMQLDYIWSPYKNFFAKISGGIFESMYGGFGGEFLYKPFDYKFSLGVESFKVKKRGFDQRFNFKKYETTTSHINMTYYFPKGIEANLSYGKYLAKDRGYTLDLSRRTKSGFTAGFYFTRTNVPAEIFGEGSFDKGFYFKIPIDLFSNSYSANYTGFKLSPLTRDGGAKLNLDKNLRDIIYNASDYEIYRYWSSFID